MGDLADDDRRHGMGIVVEYAGQKGKPQWLKPKPFRWDYAQFGKVGDSAGARRRDHRVHYRQAQRGASGLQPVDPERRSLFDAEHEADVHRAAGTGGID